MFSRCFAMGWSVWRRHASASFARQLAVQQRFGGRFGEVSGNILPSAEMADGVICAQDQIPDFAPFGDFIEVRNDEVFHGDFSEGPDLGEKDGRVVRAIQNEVYMRLAELLELTAEFLDGDGIFPVDAGKVDESDVLG